MGTKLTITIVAVALLMALAGSDVAAQVVYGQPAAGGARFIYNSWKVEVDGHDTTISQVVSPVSGFMPVKDNFDVSFYVAGSGNKLKTPSQEYTLNGLTDFRVQGRHSFANDRLLVSLGLNLPTGKTDLSLDEGWFVLQALSRNFLEMPLRRLGEGFGFNVLVGGATTAGDNVKLGAGLSYNFVGKYTPYTGIIDYNPGDVFAFNGSAEIDNGDFRYFLTAIYSLYTKDKLVGKEIFQQSPSLDTRFGLNRKGNVISYGGMLRYIIRGDNKVPQVSLDSNSALVLVSDKLYGNEFSIGGHLGWTMAEDWTIVPSVDMRYI